MAEVELGSRYYTEEHEWFEYNGGIVTVGITDHAQEALGDLVYVGDFPCVTQSFKNLNHLAEVLKRLRNAGLKVNRIRGKSDLARSKKTLKNGAP